MATTSTFEMLPDEIILNICNYLRGTDVLYSFFDLNTRLNVTIAGYCRYVNLLAPAYIPFHHVVSHVLPRIGPFVRSFVLNGNWKPVMSTNALAILFGSELFTMFPRLERLTLKWFTAEKMLLVLPNLEKLSDLVVLDIRSFSGESENDLLTKMLAATNGRLKFLFFDEDSAGLNLPEGHETVSYLNIEEVTVNINRNESLSHIFTLLPNVRRLHVTVENEIDDPKFSEAFTALLPLAHLIDFQLRLLLSPWTFNDIVNLLRLMPSLQKLTLRLITEDERLMKAENIIEVLPPSVTKLHLAIHYYFSELEFNIDELHALWPQSLPINCLLDETSDRVLFHTLPYGLRTIVLSADLSEQMTSGWHWKHMQQVEKLYVYNVESLAQVLLIVQHFHQLQNLIIGTVDTSEPCAVTLPKQPILIKLPRLKQLSILGVCPLLHFVQAAPNLYCLSVTLDCLKKLLDDEQTCVLLRQRITRLDINSWLNTEVDRIEQIAGVFCNVLQLIIDSDESTMTIEWTVVAAVTNWYDKQLQWLDIAGSLSDEAKENPRQWLTGSHESC